jgi:hypothetical protein
VPVSATELQGTVQGLSGSCPTLRFQLGARTVYTTNATTFERGSCSKMKNAMAIDVDGWLMSDNTVRADRIRLEADR